MGTEGQPIEVNINGVLTLDIGVAKDSNAGFLSGTVVNPDLNVPVFDPVKYPNPLYPPGNVYFNGVHIWPSTATLLLSQTSTSIVPRFSFPTGSWLTSGQINTMDLASSFLNTPVYFYHPLLEMDSDAYNGFELEEGAYEFIDGKIGSCSPDPKGKNPCKSAG